MVNSSSWMLSGSRNTRVEKGIGSVMSRTPVCSTPRLVRCSAHLSISAVGDVEADVVEPGAAPVEALTRVAAVLVKVDGQGTLGVEERDRVTGLLAFVVREGHRHALGPETFWYDSALAST